MRLICPHCMSGVTVPDDTAGREAVCPNCGKSFPTPARYSAAVVPDASTAVAGPIEPVRVSPHPEVPAPPIPSQAAAPPPGYVPPAVGQSGFLPPSGAESPTAGAGYTRSLGFTISPKVVGVLPAVFLTLAFVLTFFPWAATHYGGHSVYSQGPWRALVGSVDRNLDLERIAPPDTIGWPEKVRSDWLLILPFLLLLILATALALAEQGFRMFDPLKIPPLAKLWPIRHTLIAAVSAAALAFLVLQSLNGFGLERAARQVVRENPALAKEREETQGSDWKLATVQAKEELELRKFDLSRTTWMHLAVACTALGALAALGTILLERRGDKPPPKLLLHY